MRLELIEVKVRALRRCVSFSSSILCSCMWMRCSNAPGRLKEALTTTSTITTVEQGRWCLDSYPAFVVAYYCSG